MEQRGIWRYDIVKEESGGKNGGISKSNHEIRNIRVYDHRGKKNHPWPRRKVKTRRETMEIKLTYPMVEREWKEH